MSKINPQYVAAGLYAVQCMLDFGIPQEHILFITPYAAQYGCYKAEFAARDWSGVMLRTADGCQGDERPFVVIDLVSPGQEYYLGFLKDAKRMNVMFSRAEGESIPLLMTVQVADFDVDGLVVIGDKLMAKSEKHQSEIVKTWSKLVTYMERNGAHYTADDSYASTIKRNLKMPGPVYRAAKTKGDQADS